MLNFIILLLSLTTCHAFTVNVTTYGIFYSCSDICFLENNGTSVKWGEPTVGQSLSGLDFDGERTALSLDNNEFIGNLTHNNWPITGIVPQFVGFNLTITSNFNAITIPFMIGINETNNKITNEVPCPYINASEWFGLFNNESLCCPYYTENAPCSDRIRFIIPFNLEYTFFVNETEYTLFIEGIKHGGQIRDVFITQERFSTIGKIFARLIAVCAENDVCSPFNICVFGECLDGFCVYNKTIFNGKDCKTDIPLGFHPNCYTVYCFDGECIIDVNDTNGSNCIKDECDGICVNGTCDAYCRSIGDGDDDANLLPLLSLLSLLCYCLPLLCCLLLMPLCLLPLLLIAKKTPESAAVAIDTELLTKAMLNPLHEESLHVQDNQLYDE